jgi:hypothetical protein
MAVRIPSSMRVFLLVFLGLNLLQSANTPLLYDEAYFWYYAQQPALGYFEYPPMISWLIGIGLQFHGGETGVRLLPILLGAGTALFLWLCQDNPRKDARLFALVFCAFPLLHLYSFISLPNSVLLFFTALSLWAFQVFVNAPSRRRSLFLGVALAGLLYSEYLGIFVLLVMSFAQPGLIKNRLYLQALGLCLLLYSPHLIWLGLHDWVSLRYTFFERPLPEREPLAFTSGTLLKLTLVLGVMTPFVYKGLLNWKKENLVDRVSFLLACSLLVFYFLSSFQRPVSLQLLALFSLPAFLLSLSFLYERENWQKWLWPLAGVQVAILLYFRLSLIFPGMALYPHPAHDIPEWTTQLEQRSDSLPVVFENNPQKAALFSFYTGRPTYSFNTFSFRKNQYNLDTLTENKLRFQKVAYLSEQDPQAEHLSSIDSLLPALPVQFPFYSYRNLEAWLDSDKIESRTISTRKLRVYNPYQDSIPIGQLKVRVAFRDANRGILESYPAPFLVKTDEHDLEGPMDQVYLKSTDTTEFRITLPLDAPEEARYLQIALSEYGQLPGLNGRIIRLKLEEKE